MFNQWPSNYQDGSKSCWVFNEIKVFPQKTFATLRNLLWFYKLRSTFLKIFWLRPKLFVEVLKIVVYLKDDLIVGTKSFSAVPFVAIRSFSQMRDYTSVHFCIVSRSWPDEVIFSFNPSWTRSVSSHINRHWILLPFSLTLIYLENLIVPTTLCSPIMKHPNDDVATLLRNCHRDSICGGPKPYFYNCFEYRPQLSI